MREGPSVEVMADFSNISAIRSKIENLRGCRAIGRTVVLPREKTKTCFLELTATPDASPR